MPLIPVPLSFDDDEKCANEGEEEDGVEDLFNVSINGANTANILTSTALNINGLLEERHPPRMVVQEKKFSM